MSVSVVSCVYGTDFAQFLPRWFNAIADLDPAPDNVVVATDRPVESEFGAWTLVVERCGPNYPQAHYLNAAVEATETDWIWVVDIDDVAMPDALEGIGDVQADVWQMGYESSYGERYVPPQLTAAEYLALDHNPFVAGSAFTADAFARVGGYPDVAIQDWGLWCNLAANNASFQSSGRTHFHYMRHPLTRSETETTMDKRAKHLAEIERSLVT